jgi:hypothetical protein
MLIIPALRRLNQGDHKFEAYWGYVARLCLKKYIKIKSNRMPHIHKVAFYYTYPNLKR